MTPCWLLVLLLSPLWQSEGVTGWGLSTVPSESECRPYIEKAIKELSPETPQEAVDAKGSEHTTPPSQSADQEGSIEETEEATKNESIEGDTDNEAQAQSSETGEAAESDTGEIPQEESEGTSDEPTESTETKDSAHEESTEEEVKGEENSDTEEENEEVSQPSIGDAGEFAEDSENVQELTSSEKTEDTEEQSAEKPEEGEEQSAEKPEGGEEQSAENPEEGEEQSAEKPEGEEQSAEKPEEGEEQSAENPEEGAEENTLEQEELSKEETQESSEQEAEEDKQGEINEESDIADNAAEEISTEETQDATESGEKAQTQEETATSTEEQSTAEGSAENAGGEITDSIEASESEEATEPEAAEPTEVEEPDITESAEEAEPEGADLAEGEGQEDAQPETAESTEAGADEEQTESIEETGDTTDTSTEDMTPASSEEPSEALTENIEEVSTEETKEPLEDTEAAAETSAETPAESLETTVDAAVDSVEETPVESEVNNETIKATPTSEETKESDQDVPAETTDETEEQQPTADEESTKETETNVEDQLTLEFETPKIRRAREHIAEILKLTSDSAETELLLAKTIENTLKELKKLYDSAIKPLEILYKYRDLSNRHFGDPEIFSKPLILFMGPWSGGKSSIINYLLDNEFQTSSLRTGAEPSPAYFNILMWGEREEVLDGTQLAADWTFSGLQKFGQGLLDRLRGLKLNNPLLEKVNIVEIPGILEIRKQVERLFPFNDACQWFIDRADIIFLVYDPSKLDVGPETEAILDQLKGREYQTRILLNKADQVKPEELMRVQGTLIWNISPLMSSQEPPILYSTSLWSVPYEHGAPTRLLHAQERAFLRDIRAAIDKRVENKIASARRFAVRVRNHAKMVDCYLTTYYNHKTFFGNRKKVADDIIEHPQNYHIYEGLSTLTNISRYDLPDPEVYRDFFQLNAVYDFQRLSDTCTYFRGCPINRLDVAIAYDLPELVGKYKKQAERVLEVAEKQATKS